LPSRGVEPAIEKDEKEAQKWINEGLKDINYNKYQEEV